MKRILSSRCPGGQIPPTKYDLFPEKTNYSKVFDSKSPAIAKSSVYEVEKTTDRFISFIKQSPLLASGCKSG